LKLFPIYTHQLGHAVFKQPSKFQRGFKGATGKELKIRIESGLAENVNFGLPFLPKINNGKIVEDFFPNYFYKDIDGNIKYNPFDIHLSYEGHKINYKEYLDMNHESLFG